MRNKTIFQSLCWCLCFVMLCVLKVNAGPNQGADIFLYQKEFSSEQFMVAVVVNNVEDLDSYDIKLRYDSEKIFVKEIKEGPFLSSRGGTSFFLKDLSKKGEIWLTSSLSGKERFIAPDGEGEIAYITFGFLSGDRNINQDSFVFKAVSLWDSEVNKDVIVKE